MNENNFLANEKKKIPSFFIFIAVVGLLAVLIGYHCLDLG